jgi:hypothetical protein
VRYRAQYGPERAWTHDEIMALITGNGAYAHPSDVAVVIDNPLLPADYPGVFGVRHIPDTTEFAASIGHLVGDDLLLDLGRQGVELGEQDFVDPLLAFRDEGEKSEGLGFGFF